MAPLRLSPVLALAIASARRSTENYAGTAGLDRAPGRRKSRLGRSQNPWGTAQARFYHCGANRGPISAPYSSEGGPGAEVVSLFAESSRGHRRHGFLYRANGDLSSAVLLLRH